MDPRRGHSASTVDDDGLATAITTEPLDEATPDTRAAVATRTWSRPGRRREVLRSTRRQPTRGQAATRAAGSLTSTSRYRQQFRRLRQPHARTAPHDTPDEADTATADTPPGEDRKPAPGRHRRRDHKTRLIAAVKLAKDLELAGLWVVLATTSSKVAACVALATMALTHLVVTAAKHQAPHSRFTAIAALVKDLLLGGLWLTLAACSGTQAVSVALSAMAMTHLVATLSTVGERLASSGTPPHVGGGITSANVVTPARPVSAGAADIAFRVVRCQLVRLGVSVFADFLLTAQRGHAWCRQRSGWSDSSASR